MGKRLIISEQEKNDIRSRYGLIKEQNELNSEEVHEIQTALNDYFKMKKVMVGGKLYQVPVDSLWGAATIAGLKKFQQMEGLDPDGKPGPKTYSAFHKLGLAEDLMDKLVNWLLNLFN